MKMCNDSLDLLGFGPELVLAFATSIYGRKMELSHEEASMYTPSIQWAYWFMRTKLSLRLRKIVGAPVPPEVSQSFKKKSFQDLLVRILCIIFWLASRHG